MPQPFQNSLMSDLQNMSMDELIKAAQPKPVTPTEINTASKIATLAHFLIHNYRDELSPEEHVIDTAIRLLKK